MLESGRKLPDSVVDRPVGGETQALRDLGEVDPIGTGVFVALDEIQIRARHQTLYGLAKSDLLDVVVVRSDIEDLAGHEGRVGVEDEIDRLRDVLHMDEGAPELLTVDHDFAVEDRGRREVGDEEVEAHPR